MSQEVLPAEGAGVSVAITGSGGSGAVTAGLILLEAAAQAGFYGLLTRSAGPQIRGGESAAMLRFRRTPVHCVDDRFQLLVGLDWLNVSRFLDEIPLSSDSLILADPVVGAVPEALAAGGAKVEEVRFKEIADAVEGGRPNMVALGVVAARAGLPLVALEVGVCKTLAAKGTAAVSSALDCVRRGYGQPADRPAAAPTDAPVRWNISGNEASALGALRGGVRFVAAYPITPASEMLEWLAPRIERLGGALLQAEDELASVNMIIGSSFGGVPSLTATSGPGLSLMMEGLGLAVASETPVVVANVMRGGPSTGIPTKSEQSDLNIALYGLHGDAPHLVFGALSISDCAFTTEWAVRLAERLQSVAIVLSDQSLGQSRAVIDPPQALEEQPKRVTESTPGDDYQRYRITEDGVSPMALPGVTHGMYTGDGLEHDEWGTPSSLAADHQAQLQKRRRKLEDFDYGVAWGEVRGSGPLCILTWGSMAGAVFEAVDRLGDRGVEVRAVALRLLAPLPRQSLRQALEGTRRVWVVEQNQGAQLFHYLHAERALPADARSFARPGPLPIRPGEIVNALGLEV